MDPKPASQWKHTSTKDSRGHGDPIGIDLFDDEEEGFVSIYNLFADGTRFPCRTVSLAHPEHAKSVLNAWLSKQGEHHDYRVRDKTNAQI